MGKEGGEVFFTHARTNARARSLLQEKKNSKIFFFVLLFIYILEDLKLIVFIFTLTFDKPDIFFSSAFEFVFVKEGKRI